MAYVNLQTTFTKAEKLRKFDDLQAYALEMQKALEAAMQHRLHYHGAYQDQLTGSVHKVYQVVGTTILVQSCISDTGTEYHAGIANNLTQLEEAPMLEGAVAMVAALPENIKQRPVGR